MQRRNATNSGKQQFKYYEKLGGKFDEYMDDYDVARRQELIFGRLLANVTLSGRAVLEVGCGTGRFSHSIIRAGGKLTALDIGFSLAARVANELQSSAVTADATVLPFPDRSFDFVISSECIEHTADPLQAVAEMCRVCRTGGTVCLTTPNRLWYPVLWLSHVLRIRKFAGVENWVWPHQLIAEFRRARFEGVRVDGCHLWPFQLRFTRSILASVDSLGRLIYPLMINVGVAGTKGRF